MAVDGAARGTILLRHADRLGEVEQERLRHLLPAEARCITIADRPDTIAPSLCPAHRDDRDRRAEPRRARRRRAGAGAPFPAPRRRTVRTAGGAPQSPDGGDAARVGLAPQDEVRGLAAAIERAVLLGEGDAIDVAAILPPTPAAAMRSDGVARFDLDENERAVIEAALREHHHNVTHAAAALGLSRGALYRRMARHGL
ncbi:helix-turn-helix domain-containing protein [Sphingomonas sp. MMS24-JH45]